MSNLSEIEFAVMDEIYFPASLETIAKNSKHPLDLVKKTIASLLEKKFIHQMKFNEAMNDYERLTVTDFRNLEQYLYVASKQGLSAHNG